MCFSLLWHTKRRLILFIFFSTSPLTIFPRGIYLIPFFSCTVIFDLKYFIWFKVLVMKIPRGGETNFCCYFGTKFIKFWHNFDKNLFLIKFVRKKVASFIFPLLTLMIFLLEQFSVFVIKSRKNVFAFFLFKSNRLIAHLTLISLLRKALPESQKWSIPTPQQVSFNFFKERENLAIRDVA